MFYMYVNLKLKIGKIPLLNSVAANGLAIETNNPPILGSGPRKWLLLLAFPVPSVLLSSFCLSSLPTITYARFRHMSQKLSFIMQVFLAFAGTHPLTPYQRKSFDGVGEGC